MDEITELTEAECEAYLAANSLGRLALVVDGRPEIFPLNYASDGPDLLFRTVEGTKMRAAPMSWVAFEIDGIDPEAGCAWSVVVKGVAHDVSDTLDELSERVRSLAATPTGPGDHPLSLALRGELVSGRRVPLNRRP